MRVLEVTNLNQAYGIMMRDLMSMSRSSRWRLITPRNGEETWEYREPVTTVYQHPRERVLFDEVRDANPFFHYMEAIWILAGRNDVAWISQFNKQISKYSDGGDIFNGAYGYRLRSTGKDQVGEAIALLIDEPDTRRCVLAMWHMRDLGSTSNDIPCNTHIYLKIRDGKLNMTVCCRSNDMIWGAYGANAVHFSILQEYIAASVDVGVGKYTHISDSLHVYTSNPTFKAGYNEIPVKYSYANELSRTSYKVSPSPLVQDPVQFDKELEDFMTPSWWMVAYREPFFQDAFYMRNAWDYYKSGVAKDVVLSHLNRIQAEDWKVVTKQWMNRRYDNANATN